MCDGSERSGIGVIGVDDLYIYTYIMFTIRWNHVHNQVKHHMKFDLSCACISVLLIFSNASQNTNKDDE